MPAVYLSKQQEREARATCILRMEIYGSGTNQKAFAEKVGMVQGTLHKRVHMPETMTLGELWKVLDALHTPEDVRAEILK